MKLGDPRFPQTALRSMTRRYERVEVITGVAGRRRWSAAENLRIVGELARKGATVSSVARAQDVHESLMFKWRRLAREGTLGPAGAGASGRSDSGMGGSVTMKCVVAPPLTVTAGAGRSRTSRGR